MDIELLENRVYGKLGLLRKVASGNKWQMRFSAAERFSNIKLLFENDDKFSRMQEIFIYWLLVYHNLYDELAYGEDFLTPSVIEDITRTDAFLFYKNRERRLKAEENKNRNKKKHNNENILVFEREED